MHLMIDTNSNIVSQKVHTTIQVFKKYIHTYTLLNFRGRSNIVEFQKNQVKTDHIDFQNARQSSEPKKGHFAMYEHVFFSSWQNASFWWLS